MKIKKISEAVEGFEREASSMSNLGKVINHKDKKASSIDGVINMDPVMGGAYVDSIRRNTEIDDIMDPVVKEIDKEGPEFGAKKQPKPKKPVEPKIELDESLFLEDYNDGWNLEDHEIIDVLDEIYNLQYEIKNTVRGVYSRAETYRELGEYITSLAEKLERAAYDIEDLDESYNRSLKEAEETKKPSGEALLAYIRKSKASTDRMFKTLLMWLPDSTVNKFMKDYGISAKNESLKTNRLNEVYYDDEKKQEFADFIQDTIWGALDNIYIVANSEIRDLPEPPDESYNQDKVDSAVDDLVEAIVDDYFWFNESMQFNNKKNKLTEAKWNLTLESGKDLRRAIDNEDIEATKEALIDCYSEIFNKMPEYFDEDDYDRKVEDIRWLEDEDSIDFELNELYDFCDNLRIWIPLEESCGKKHYRKKLKEANEPKETVDISAVIDDDADIPDEERRKVFNSIPDDRADFLNASKFDRLMMELSPDNYGNIRVANDGKFFNYVNSDRYLVDDISVDFDDSGNTYILVKSDTEDHLEFAKVISDYYGADYEVFAPGETTGMGSQYPRDKYVLRIKLTDSDLEDPWETPEQRKERKKAAKVADQEIK